jgi:RHS repeat-associated protein
LFDPFGKPLTVVDLLGNKNKFRYKAGYSDPGDGMIYMNGRYYVSKWGRFLNADGSSAANPYVFQGANPLR